MSEREGVVTAAAANVRPEPSTALPPVAQLTRRTRVRVLDTVEGWYRIEAPGCSGFIHGDLVAIVDADAVAGFLWEQPRFHGVPLECPGEERLGLPAGAGATARTLIETWNMQGGLLRALSETIGIDEACAVAVLVVESAGRSFGPDGRMTIRFENHLFRRFWGAKHPDAFAQHFRFQPAQPWRDHFWRPSPGGEWINFHGSQAREWEVFEFARRIDEVAAMFSISMGGPQIMGFNHSVIGYLTVQEMFEHFRTDLRFHVLGLFDFLRGSGTTSPMVEALRLKNYARFASFYNGPGQAAVYGDLIARNVEAFQSLLRTAPRIGPVTPPAGTSTPPPHPPPPPPPPVEEPSTDTTASTTAQDEPASTASSTATLEAPAEPAEAEPAGEAMEATTYTVRPGDTLGGIAGRFGVTLATLVAANGIANPDLIIAGQVIEIPARVLPPAPGEVDTTPQRDLPEDVVAPPTTYTVRPGDTLSGIASRFQVAMPQLAALNRISNVDLIYVGQVLRIP